MASKKQLRLLALVKAEGLMDHEDKRLNEFCDDNGDQPDTFNQCHNAGWLRTWHSSDDYSTVMITDVGEERLEAEMAK